MTDQTSGAGGRPLTKTRHPGIYKRGNRYVAIVRVNGKPKKFAARTLDDARRIRSKRQSEAHAGEFFEASRLRFGAYADEWVERYAGRGRRGFRESTRDDYRRDLQRYAKPYLDGRLSRRLGEIAPRDIANFLGWLCDEAEQTRRAEDAGTAGRDRTVLADATVRRVLSPVRACLATAVQEGLIRGNPTIGAALPHRPVVDEHADEERRVLTRLQLAAFLDIVHPEHRTFFELLASTGLRISEAIALRWCDIELDGSDPRVLVRRALVRGRIGPPKSRYGRRKVPLTHGLVLALRERRIAAYGAVDEDLVFRARNGEPLRPENLRRRVLKPAMEEVGAPWAGFHTLRHGAASLLFAEGRNAVQVQRWLGHHSPAFTLSTYVHLLDGDLGAPLEVRALKTPGHATLDAPAPPSALEALLADDY